MTVPQVIVPQRIVTYLKEHPRMAFCHNCLQRGLNLARPQQAQQATAPLREPDFDRRQGPCSRCGEDRMVTKYIGD